MESIYWVFRYSEYMGIQIFRMHGYSPMQIFTHSHVFPIVVIQYPYAHFDISWVPTVPTWSMLLRSLCQVYQTLQVTFLPVYEPSEAEQADAELYAENVRAVMATALNVPTTNHAFEDVMLWAKMGDDAHVVLKSMDLASMQTLTHMTKREIEILVERFTRKDANGDGQISLDEMHEMLEISTSDRYLPTLFHLLDSDGNGSIDFRELCLGLSILSPKCSRDQIIPFAFSLYDADGDGIITAPELTQVLALTNRMMGESRPVKLRHPEIMRKVETSGQVTLAEFRRMANAKPSVIDLVFQKLLPLSGRGSK